MVDVSHQPALGIMRVVSQRDTATLYPIIQQFCKPGTTIHSDEWSAYRAITSTIPSITAQSFVNHSLNFVDPVTGVHTQNVESYWNRVKTKLKRMKGCDGDQLPSYLDEFMWRERHGTTSWEAFDNICRDIALKYPV